MIVTIVILILSRNMYDISKEYYKIIKYKDTNVITEVSCTLLLTVWYNQNVKLLTTFGVKQTG